MIRRSRTWANSSSGSGRSTSGAASSSIGWSNDAQRIVRGVEPQALRDNRTLRQQIATQLSGVQSVLDGLMVDRPRRNILRSRQGQVA